MQSKKFPNFVSEATVYKSKRWKSSAVRFETSENFQLLLHNLNTIRSALVLYILRTV